MRGRARMAGWTWTAVVVALGACGPARGVATADAKTAATPVGPLEVGLLVRHLGFVPSAILVPAGRSLTIRFENADVGVGHAITIHRVSPSRSSVAAAPPTVGPDLARYLLPALDAGEYRVGCAIHPNLTATMVAS